MEEKIARMMKNLGLTREEAIQLIKDDSRIDAGEKLFELSKEQKSAEKKARSMGTRKAPATREKKQKEEDTQLSALYAALMQGAMEVADDGVEGSDNKRTLTLMIDERKFKITISCPRS